MYEVCARLPFMVGRKEKEKNMKQEYLLMFWITYYESINEENSTSERRGFPQKKMVTVGNTLVFIAIT